MDRSFGITDSTPLHFCSHPAAVSICTQELAPTLLCWPLTTCCQSLQNWIWTNPKNWSPSQLTCSGVDFVCSLPLWLNSLARGTLTSELLCALSHTPVCFFLFMSFLLYLPIWGCLLIRTSSQTSFHWGKSAWIQIIEEEEWTEYSRPFKSFKP